MKQWLLKVILSVLWLSVPSSTRKQVPSPFTEATFLLDVAASFAYAVQLIVFLLRDLISLSISIFCGGRLLCYFALAIDRLKRCVRYGCSVIVVSVDTIVIVNSRITFAS